MASRIASFVGQVQLRLKIESATSSEDDATPMYLLDETVQMIGSSAKNVTDAVVVIRERLEHRSPTVKQKALRLVKHAAQKGSPALRHVLARDATAVRELTSFRCAPDPFKGDIPWKRVQEYAKEALDALHAAPAAQSAASSSSLGGRIQGFGSDTGSRSGMMGFGSESAGLMGGGGSGFGGGNAMLDSFSSGVKGLTDRAMGALTRPQHTLLAGDSEDENGWGAGAALNASTQASAHHSLGGAGLAASSASPQQPSSAEQRAVTRVCTPGGLRAAPSAEELRAFVEGVAPLDGVVVAKLLQDQMVNGSWQEALRALCALEALLEGGTSAAAGEAAVHFQGDPSAVRRARQSAQATVRQRAERVLKLIGDETLPGGGGASGGAQGGPSKGVDDLLGGLILQDEAPGGAAPAAPSASTSTDPMDLLAGLDAAPPAAAADLLWAPEAGGSTPAPAAPAAVDDMFGDWAAPQPAAAAPPAAAPGFAGLDDLFSSAPPAGGMPGMPSAGGAIPTAGPVDSLAGLLGSSHVPSPPAMRQMAPQAALGGFVGVAPQPPSAGADPFAMLRQPPPAPSAFAGQPALGGGFAAPPAHARVGSGGLGSGASLGEVDVLGALRAATSGISSAKREDAAFNFVDSAMQRAKKK